MLISGTAGSWTRYTFNFLISCQTPFQSGCTFYIFASSVGTILCKCPSANEWIKKLWYICTKEFYAAERKKKLIPFAIAWMELESICSVNKSCSEGQIPYDLTFNWNIINNRK